MQEVCQNFDNEEELMLRQVHPSFIQAGRVTSQAFRPTPKDDKKLSTNRESMCSAQDSYKLHTETKKLQSAGVWAVSVGEVQEFPELELVIDPVKGDVPDPSHCLVDFSKVNAESRIKAIASKLVDKARCRGCLFSSS